MLGELRPALPRCSGTGFPPGEAFRLGLNREKEARVCLGARGVGAGDAEHGQAQQGLKQKGVRQMKR